MNSRGAPLGGGIGLLLAVLAGLVLAWCGSAGPAEARFPFKPLRGASIDNFKTFDLGVADANDDGNLDLFTTNHKYPSELLLGNGSGRLFDAEARLGVSPTPAFPGFEDVNSRPNTSRPGVYLYVTARRPKDPLHIRTTGVGASGRLVFVSSDLKIEKKTNATVSSERLPGGFTAFDFTAQPGANIRLSVEHIDLPIRTDLDRPLDKSLIKVGADAVPATRGDFTVALRDRHGYGFGDFDSDGATDLFISLGGLGDTLGDPRFAGHQTDELLMGGPTGYRPEPPTSRGLVKGNCPGRGVIVDDFDGNGLLDLLESCEGKQARMFGGNGAGRFYELPVPPVRGDLYRALDLIADSRPELVTATGRRIQVWTLAGDRWVRRQTLRGRNGRSPIHRFALGDFDGDADLDLFAASPGGNVMLVNARGKLRKRAPGALGLPPGGSAGAAFADYDNDGDLDVHLLPQGLFRSDPRRFRSTGLLGYGRLGGGAVRYGSVSWPDLDEDGRRDPVSSRGRSEFAADQRVDLRRSRVRAGHWLEIDLVGPAGNRQAIGARAMVRTRGGRTWAWVGEAETSAHSSGHYRLYFGLGRNRRVRGITVSWPDGTRTTLGPQRANRVLRVAHG